MPKAFLLVALCTAPLLQAAEIHVSPTGDDANPGSRDAPLKSFAAAQTIARKFAATPARDAIEIIFADGIYRLPETVVFTPEDSGNKSREVIYRAALEGMAVISGGDEAKLQWQRGNGEQWIAKLPQTGGKIDQLYLNGERQRMARFPNADAAPGKNVYDTWTLEHTQQPDPQKDPLTPERIARWKNPQGAYLHAMHISLWGDMKWLVKGKKADGTLDLEGGWQNNRPSKMHPRYRMVENVLEELDAPGEWFHDAASGTLHVIPPAGVDIAKATVEFVRLDSLIQFRGTKDRPVQGISLDGFTFRHAARTFMENKEPLLRSDWTVSRSGSVFFEGATDCEVVNSTFDQVGGNAVFVNNWNRRVSIKGCLIKNSGASGVVFAGDPAMVRSPLFRYGGQPWDKVERTPGPKGDNYPESCRVEDCLITRSGRDEKQTAGVQISISHKITVKDCSIYEVPRAGININEGTFGGHLIEGCDVFDTVLETGDHGSFNSWGRDRFWQPDIRLTNEELKKEPGLPYLDILDVNTIRDSRWRCDHGWDIDLDDGSTRYRISRNLLLGGGLKLREGFDRIAENNVIVNNSLHPHVWYDQSEDVFRNNIIMDEYRPAGGMPPGKWGKQLDFNFFVGSDAARTKFSDHGCDAGSLSGDPMFVDAAKGDFRVKEDSPALKLGFENFPMDRFGVKKPSLRAIARTPEIPALKAAAPEPKEKDQLVMGWHGLTLADLKGEDFSAFGVNKSDGGVQVADGPAKLPADPKTLRKGDLILSIGGKPVRNRETFFQAITLLGESKVRGKIVRNQQERDFEMDGGVLLESSALGDLAKLKFAPASESKVTSSIPTSNEPLATLTDGKLAENYGAIFSNGARGAAYKMDLGERRKINAVNSWTYDMSGTRGAVRVAIFASSSEGDPGWDVADRGKFTPLTVIDTRGIETKKFNAASYRLGGEAKEFRWVLWLPLPLNATGEYPAFQELGVDAE